MTKNKITMVLGIAALLIVSYFIPTMVTVAEDNSLKREAKTFAIDDIDISADEFSVAAMIADYPDILNQDKMYVKEGKNLDAGSVYEKEKDFLNLFVPLLAADFTGIQSLDIVYHAETAYLTTSPDYEQVYYIWECRLSDNQGYEYTVYIDDATGTIMAFEGPFFWDFFQKANLQTWLSAITEYYGFSEYEFVFPDKTGESQLRFYDENWQEQMNIPILFTETTVLFNMVDNFFTDGDYTDESIYSEAEIKKLYGLY